MAEDVVEDVRLLDVVELAGLPDELPGGEPAVGEVVEEDLVRHQRGHGHDAPAGELLELVGQTREIGDAFGDEIEGFQARQELVTGAPGQHLRLTLVQCLPDTVLRCIVAFPMLVDGEIGPDLGVLGAKGVEVGHVPNRERTNEAVKRHA